MVDKTKKVKLTELDMPLVNSDNTRTFKYRIVGEDGIPLSDWSGLYQASAPDVRTVSANVGVNNGLISLVWDDENNRPEYDVFVKFEKTGGTVETEYTYHGTTQVHSYSFIKKFFDPLVVDVPNRLHARVQVASVNKETFGTGYSDNPLLIFQGSFDV